jgi:hypothetical protein
MERRLGEWRVRRLVEMKWLVEKRSLVIWMVRSKGEMLGSHLEQKWGRRLGLLDRKLVGKRELRKERLLVGMLEQMG